MHIPPSTFLYNPLSPTTVYAALSHYRIRHSLPLPYMPLSPTTVYAPQV